MLTQERLRKLIEYDPETGIFRWTHRDDGSANWNARWAGKVAGSLNDKGYLIIRVDYTKYRAHRLAYLYMEGYMPREVDHIDHNRSNNAFRNLRDADRSSNGQNVSMHSTNTSGFTGVHWDKKRCRWVAQIMVDGKVVFLGRHKRIASAIEARTSANDRFKFHDNHGKPDELIEAA